MGRPRTTNGAAPTPRIVIVGAGFGGIGLGIELRKAGIGSFQILEREDAIGGVWRDNHYPGLTCDIPSHLYSLSSEPIFSRSFAQRMVTTHSPLPSLSHQPTMPPNSSRSNGSSSAITWVAA